MKKIVFSLILLFASAALWAQPPFGHHSMPSVEQRIERMTTELQLDEKQRTKLTKIMSQADQKRQALHQQLKQLREDSRKQIDAVLTEEQRQKLAAKRSAHPKPGAMCPHQKMPPQPQGPDQQ